MSKVKPLEECKTYKDFFAYAKSKGAKIEYSGKHAKIVGPKGGKVPVPMHTGEIKIGTRKAIIKMLIAIGLGIFPLVCYFSFWFANKF